VPSPGKDELARLFACAADPDFRVAGPAFMMLKALTVSAKSLPDWLVLLRAPDVAVRRLAVDRVGDRDTAEVAAALLEQVNHPDRALLRQPAAHSAGQGRPIRTRCDRCLGILRRPDRLDAGRPDRDPRDKRTVVDRQGRLERLHSHSQLDAEEAVRAGLERDARPDPFLGK